MADNHLKIYKGTTHVPQDSEPTNPVNGDMYYDQTLQKFRVFENNSWKALGEGGGGSGKNYFDSTSANIENSTGNWLTDNGAGAASTNLTLSLTSVAGELLQGETSLKLVKSAANSNGHFIKLASETIDPIDRGKQLFGSFAFKPISGYVSGDLILEIFDVTNSAVLYSGPSEDLELLNVTDPITFNYNAHLESTTAQIEFRLKVNNTNTNTFTMTFDEFGIGPASVLPAVNATEWEQFTATFNNTGGWTILQDCQKRRIGDLMHVKLSLAFTGAGSGTDIFGFNIPDGLTLKGSSVAAGPYLIFNFNNNNAHLASFGQFFQKKSITFVNPGTTGSITANNLVSTSYIRAEFFIPIAEWQASSTMTTNELGLQSARFLAAKNVVQTGVNPNNSLVKLTLNVILEDTLSSFDLPNSRYIVPKSGLYRVSANAIISSGVNVLEDGYFLRLIVNGAGGLIGGETKATANDGFVLGLSGEVLLSKGDTVEIGIFGRGNNSVNAIGVNSAQFFASRQEDLTLIGAVRDNNSLTMPEVRKLADQRTVDYTNDDFVPIVASGSNSDGNWTRYADGTQICNYVGPSQTFPVGPTLINWAFPAQFSAIPSSTGDWVAVQSENHKFGIEGISSALLQGFLFNSTGASRSGPFLFTAIGRWK